jgi:hypothetical protein
MEKREVRCKDKSLARENGRNLEVSGRVKL